MKLIIDIDENVFTRLFDNGIQDNEISVDDICEMARALRLGKPLLEEFKKIKAEIMATGNWKSEYEISDRGVIKAVEVIDNHISELKGSD